MLAEHDVDVVDDVVGIIGVAAFNGGVKITRVSSSSFVDGDAVMADVLHLER
jgi:hypothetical protein